MSYERPPYRDDAPDELRRRGNLVLRTLPILLIPLGVSLIALLLLRPVAVAPPVDRPPFTPALPILVLVIFFSALIVLVRTGRPNISAIALVGVWTLLTTAAMLQAGVSSNLVALLIIPICVAGLLIDGVASISLAALATLLVASLAWLESQGLAPGGGLPPLPVESPALSAAIFWTGLFWTVAALTSMLAGGVQRALRESRRRAEELRRLSESLEARVQAQTAELLARAEERATLEERARLAREIHDTIAQGLAGVAVQVGAARQGLALLPAGADERLVAALRENLSLAERMTRETMAEARRSVWSLRAPLLERGSLADALHQVAARAALPVRFAVAGEAWPMSPAVEGALLRAAQEALANVGKHAGAAGAVLELRYAPDAVELSVADDGRGFPPELLARRPAPGVDGGFGLLGIEERIAALGGSLSLGNEGGARVRVVVPRIGGGLEGRSPSEKNLA